ncbi:MAG: hypothetical protein L3K09_06490 [Thermoplasmata archaeon]|nr:hypothetical protein [Thermoplasmata archaeon]
MTKDSALYADLAPSLRDRRIPLVGLVPGQKIPDRVGVVLTTPDEAQAIRHPDVIAVRPETDHTALIAYVQSILTARGGSGDVIVGIDPGPRPGFAVLQDGHRLIEGVLDSPEAVAELGEHLKQRFTAHGIVFRVGSGDPARRNRIVNALLPLHRPVELVDEAGTTPPGRRRPGDTAAAGTIAGTPGRAVSGRMALRVTPGQIADVQRLSRMDSGGRFTIPRALADRVLRGELSLSQAVAEGEHRYGALARSPRSPVGAPRELS